MRHRPSTFIERVTLFVSTMHKDTAPQLFESLSETQLIRAKKHAKTIANLDSATRQAQLACEFGVRGDAVERLQALLSHCAPPLRSAIVQLMPAKWRTHFPKVRFDDTTCPPAELRAMALRLIDEAVR